MAFLVDGWRTGVLNSSCSLLCALSWSWKCSAWSCMSTSQTTKIWQSGNHTRSQNNWLAMVIMHVLWLGKGLTGTEFGKHRWFSRDLSNAQDFVSGSRAGAEEGNNFNESIVFWYCSNNEPLPWLIHHLNYSGFVQVNTLLRMKSYKERQKKTILK